MLFQDNLKDLRFGSLLDSAKYLRPSSPILFLYNFKDSRLPKVSEAPKAFAVKAVNFLPVMVKRLSCLIERALAKDSAAASLKFAKLKSRVS